jgi:hypothetical protein
MGAAEGGAGLIALCVVESCMTARSPETNRASTMARGEVAGLPRAMTKNLLQRGNSSDRLRIWLGGHCRRPDIRVLQASQGLRLSYKPADDGSFKK